MLKNLQVKSSCIWNIKKKIHSFFAFHWEITWNYFHRWNINDIMSLCILQMKCKKLKSRLVFDVLMHVLLKCKFLIYQINWFWSALHATKMMWKKSNASIINFAHISASRDKISLTLRESVNEFWGCRRHRKRLGCLDSERVGSYFLSNLNLCLFRKNKMRVCDSNSQCRHGRMSTRCMPVYFTK